MYWSGLRRLGFARPGIHYCFYQRGKWDREKHAPETPKTTEEKHCNNDRDRMQIHHFRKQHGNQDIAIQYLDQGVDTHHPGKFCAPAELEKRHDCDGDRHHRRADVGHYH